MENKKYSQASNVQTSNVMSILETCMFAKKYFGGFSSTACVDLVESYTKDPALFGEIATKDRTFVGDLNGKQNPDFSK